jgi:hypothetical protein
MYICVDFDGTIVDHRYPDIGPEAPGAIAALKSFSKAGAKLILFTMRCGEELDQAVAYLKKNGVELYGVNHNPDQASWTKSPKAYGHVYIDDAALGCPTVNIEGFFRPCVDWAKVIDEITRRALKAVG